MNLRSKFLLLIFSISTIAITTFIYLTTNSLNKIAISTTGPAQQKITKQVSNEIDRIINQKIKELKIAANTSKIIETANDINSKKNIESGTKELISFSRITGPWNKLTLIDLELNTLTHSNLKEVENGVNTINLTKENNKNFSRILDGETVVLEDTDLNGKPTITICTPIRDDNLIGNPVVGALYGELSWPLIEEVLKKVDSNIFIINSNDELIGIGNSLEKKYFEKYEFIETFKDTTEESEYHLVDLPNSDKLILTYSQQKGYLDFIGSDWKIVSETKLSTLNSDSITSLKKIFYSTIPIFLLFLIIITFFIEKIIIRPILELTVLTKKLAEGDFSNKAKETSNDEIGTLSKSFNETSQIISNYRTKIEKEVTDRTKELEDVLEKTKDSRDTLEKQAKQLEKMNNFMINREVKMKELKEEIKKNK